MTRYSILSEHAYHLSNYHLTALRWEDMGAIKQWRNAQMDVLRQNRVLTDDDQDQYYQSAVLPSFQSPQPKNILFSYFYKGNCIGYGGLTNMDWQVRRGEISFLVDPARATQPELYHEDFLFFLRLLKHISFKELSLQRIFTETYDIRPGHVQVLEAEGFQLEGRLRRHMLIQNRVVDVLFHGCLNERQGE